MDKIKNIFRKAWWYIYYTKLGKLFASVLLAFVSFALANIWDFMFWVAFVFMIYPIGLTLVMIVYAWIINPINDFKAKKKVKEDAKNAPEKAPSSKIMSPTVVITEVDNTVASEENKLTKKIAKKKSSNKNKKNK